jgi:hypothetical protein
LAIGFPQARMPSALKFVCLQFLITERGVLRSRGRDAGGLGPAASLPYVNPRDIADTLQTEMWQIESAARPVRESSASMDIFEITFEST